MMGDKYYRYIVLCRGGRKEKMRITGLLTRGHTETASMPSPSLLGPALALSLSLSLTAFFFHDRPLLASFRRVAMASLPHPDNYTLKYYFVRGATFMGPRHQGQKETSVYSERRSSGLGILHWSCQMLLSCNPPPLHSPSPFPSIPSTRVPSAEEALGIKKKKIEVSGGSEGEGVKDGVFLELARIYRHM
ncbi:hypothetical protein BGZ63DRAFT_79044 [Mariannaea sp. PMI_226]|nr:hypothetical protein BGZ63DRAFT_79044 [Mariannaea sp. PMI_226]